MGLISHPRRSNVLSSVSSLCFFHFFSSPRFPWGMLRFYLIVLGLLTLFRCTVTLPFASIVAVSPRNDTTLPRMRTVWLVKEPRYLALTRGVASDMVSEWSSRERIRKAVNLQRLGRQN